MTAHARTVRLTDLPILAFHSRRVYPNQAITFEHGDASQRLRPNLRRLLRACLLPRNERGIWISRDGGTLLGVAALRRRGGRSAWEIDALITTVPNEAFLLDLLDRAVATAGADGAHRLFLRLPSDSAIVDPSLRHGFLAVTEETLYAAAQPLPLQATVSGARRRQRSDDHALFRLYSQAVPQEVRWQTALSPTEWRAALEPLGGGGEEWVLPAADGAGVEAFVRLCRSASGARVSLLTEGQAPQAESGLALALARAPKKRRFQVLLPEYALAERRAAEMIGLEPVAQYLLLVRPIAQRARRLQLAERKVEGSVRPVIQ